jgi:Protein of unknown function (DUF2958)
MRRLHSTLDNAEPDIDFKPLVKLFTPDAQCTWLVTELGYVSTPTKHVRTDTSLRDGTYADGLQSL